MLTTRSRLVLGFACVSAIGACGTDPPAVGGEDFDGGTFVPDAAIGPCATAQTQSCSCISGGAGTQTCTNGVWSECGNCGVYTVDGGSSGGGGSCKPGLYVGSFSGTYRSAFAFGGGIPVEALDLVGGTTGLSFVLTEKQEGVGGEFATYSIENGFVRGTASGFFPFEGILTGELNCATKEFKGQLEGCYAIGADAVFNVGQFIGPTPGTYDTATQSFPSGTWTLSEKMPFLPLPNLGGEGKWNATWKGPAPANAMPPGAPNCKVASDGDGGVVRVDAGT